MARREGLFDAVVITAQVIGHELSQHAAEDMARELSSYAPAAVLKALKRCKFECKGRLTLADIVQRIDDGHLGAEAAWALCPRDEASTVVWTDEIAQAFEVARPLLAAGDAVAARMAFREMYTGLLQQARTERQSAKWWVSPGSDAASRDRAIVAAAELGRLAPDAALYALNPGDSNFERNEARVRALQAADTPLLGAK